MRDLANNLGPAQSIRPQAVTATLNGTGVDLRGFDSALLQLDFGTFAGTGPSATVKWQESDDDATYTDIATADLIGGAVPAITPTNDEAIIKRGYAGTKRYVRAIVSAISGTGPSLPMSATVIRGHASQQPVA